MSGPVLMVLFKLIFWKTSENEQVSELLRAIPQMSRADLFRVAQDSGDLCVVQETYEMDLPLIADSLSRARFSKHQGLRRVEPFFGALLRDARLIGPYAIPFTQRGELVVEPFGERWLKKVIRETIRELGIRGFLFQYALSFKALSWMTSPKFPLLGYLIPRATQDPGDAQFGHWMCEQLPQLRAIEAIEEKLGASIPLLLNRNLRDWQIETLRMMGRSPDQFVRHQSKGYRVGTIVISSLRNVHSRGMEFDPVARKWASQRLRAGMAPAWAKEVRQNRLYVSRLEQYGRKLLNGKKIEDLMKSRDYSIVCPGRGSTIEDAAQFSAAEIIIGVFGSGLTNLLFATHPKVLVEIFGPREKDREVFFLLCAELGLTHISVEAAEVGDADFTNVSQSPGDYSVVANLDELNSAISLAERIVLRPQ